MIEEPEPPKTKIEPTVQTFHGDFESVQANQQEIEKMLVTSDSQICNFLPFSKEEKRGILATDLMGLGYDVQRNEQGPLCVTIGDPQQCDIIIKKLQETYFNNDEPTKQEITENYVVGFDCEFSGGLVETIQVSTASLSCVFRARKIHAKNGGKLPDSLLQLLVNSNIFKLGVGIIHDYEKVKSTFQVETQGIIDISIVALKLGIAESYRGLDFLAKDLVSLGKLNKVASRASIKFFEYGARDAYLGYAIARTLHSYNNTKSSNQLFHNWISIVKPTLQELLVTKIKDFNEKKQTTTTTNKKISTFRNDGNNEQMDEIDEYLTSKRRKQEE